MSVQKEEEEQKKKNKKQRKKQSASIKMANNVFGNPVTNDTVRLIYPNLPVSDITAGHRAQVAMLYRNADGKADNASRFVHELKDRYGTGTSTLCTLYNATGGPITFVLKNTWEGEVWNSPYPHIIQNGQWAAFLHVRSRLMGPSKEAVVYNGRNNNGVSCDWMVAWNTPRRDFQNRVLTQIRNAGFFRTVNWGTIDNLMERQRNNHSDTWNGCHSIVSIGAGSSPQFVATLTLANLPGNLLLMADDVSGVPKMLDSNYADDADEDDEATLAVVE